MLRNFSFLIEGALAGSALPGSWSDLESDLQEAINQGITAVVTLTEHPLDQDVVSELGLRYLHLPIEDYTPPTLEQMQSFVHFVDAERARGGAVLAHCHAGIGRTGTMLSAYLVSAGRTAENAMREVRNSRPGSVETRSQAAVLKEFEKMNRKQPFRQD